MTDSTLPGVLWMPNNNFWPGRDGSAPRWIVLHATAGGTDAVAVANYMISTYATDNPVSVHYVIGQDGTVVQCIAESDTAWGNGVLDGVPATNLPFRTASDGIHRDAWWDPAINPNYQTISIEHCKPSSDNSDALTPAQQASSFALILDICKRQGVPMRFADASGGITGHFSLDAVSRQHCPGLYPWQDLWTYLATQGGIINMLQITDPFAARHFIAIDDTHWKCKENGIVIQDAILEKWRVTQGLTRLPLTPEIYDVIPGGSFQVCECGVWVWDPQHNLDDPGQGPVYMMHLDKDTPGLRRLMALAGIATPNVTAEQLASAVTAVKTAGTNLAVALSDLEPVHS